MCVSIQGQCHFLALAQGYLHIKIKTCFSQKNWAIFIQILHVSFQVQENEHLLIQVLAFQKSYGRLASFIAYEPQLQVSVGTFKFINALKKLNNVGEYGPVNYSTSGMLDNCWGVWINIDFLLVFRQLMRNALSRAHWYGLTLKLMRL